MATIVTDMDTHASENTVMRLVSRLERDGHHLTTKAAEQIHRIITDCLPDNRPEGNQRELGKFIQERMDREP
jgi:hypothetical protein